MGVTGRRNIHKQEVAKYVQNTAEIYGRCELLLGYARQETEEVQLELDSDIMRRALLMVGFPENLWDAELSRIIAEEPES